MLTKIIHLTCAASLTLFAASVILFALSLALNPWDHRVSFSDDFHVGLWRGRIVFFNDSEYGPYRGSVVGLYDENGQVYPPRERKISWGDSFGVYYRYFRWTDSTLWTLMVSLLWPIGIFSLPAAYYLRLRRLRRAEIQPPTDNRETAPPSL